MISGSVLPRCFPANPATPAGRQPIIGCLSTECSGSLARALLGAICPPRYGAWSSVYQRFNWWAKAGVWEQVFERLQDPDVEWLMIDTTVVRAHQHAAGQKK